MELSISICCDRERCQIGAPSSAELLFSILLLSPAASGAESEHKAVHLRLSFELTDSLDLLNAGGEGSIIFRLNGFRIAMTVNFELC